MPPTPTSSANPTGPASASRSLTSAKKKASKKRSGGSTRTEDSKPSIPPSGAGDKYQKYLTDRYVDTDKVAAELDVGDIIRWSDASDHQSRWAPIWMIDRAAHQVTVFQAPGESNWQTIPDACVVRVKIEKGTP